jgi:hypothetical protein
MLDLFQPPQLRPLPTRIVKLLADDPPPRPGRQFIGPPRPRKPYKRTAEQNREKNRRYAEKVGRDVINARERARYWRVKHESR